VAISKAQADALIDEPKLISANLVWRSWGRGRRAEVAVLGTQSGALLRLNCWLGPYDNRSFALLHNNQPIRKWTVHARTKAPDDGPIYGPHKHTWDDELGDEYTYVPDDIRVGDAEEEFEDFLAECNIVFIGGVQSTMPG
jgi:hypothetical protein